jgi:type 1 fimbria pilin
VTVLQHRLQVISPLLLTSHWLTSKPAGLNTRYQVFSFYQTLLPGADISTGQQDPMQQGSNGVVVMHIFRVLPFMLTSLVSLNALAIQPDQGHGVVHMNGSILETPCAIDVADREQAVELGTETVGELIHDGKGPARPFAIHLVNCVIRPTEQGLAASRFQVTFDGKPDEGLFGVVGAEGVGLQITDIAGNVAVPGQPMPYESIRSGPMELDYVLRLVGDRSQLHAGDYSSAIRFKIDYF